MILERPLWLVVVLLALRAARCDVVLAEERPPPAGVDVRTTLECHPRVYNSTVSRSDRNGRTCFDHVSVTSCWGRCDSNEISDYRFPYKRSHHPVCIHDVHEPRVVVLRHCQEGVEPGTERYEYLEAKRCSCQVCRSSEASCEGLRYRAPGPSGPAGPAALVPALVEQVRQLPMVINNRGD
ncbi:Glycoprotein hormone beta5 [Frankliniella occidentalis]|uniref:Thyrostimulin beta-5 subunit n=1 Tax=Frankliniella occidentalis TaxID=133901 RepID=A0A6J1RWY4_FRAOC|nr:thyrostimulin beta-5 subunit [Frankliniella occidentalis]KAE8739983.1 Glycoprotein hormone beta5 [Frankliniella occidentalis]